MYSVIKIAHNFRMYIKKHCNLVQKNINYIRNNFTFLAEIYENSYKQKCKEIIKLFIQEYNDKII
jgi:hypothetical protein